MGKRSRVSHKPMPHLRAWRESLGLSRQAVVDALTFQHPDVCIIDQATIEKWESGKTAVRVEDITLLAEIYGVTPDRLFFAPGDKATPERLRRAYDILVAVDDEAADGWLKVGELLAHRGPVS